MGKISPKIYFECKMIFFIESKYIYLIAIPTVLVKKKCRWKVSHLLQTNNFYQKFFPWAYWSVIPFNIFIEILRIYKNLKIFPISMDNYIQGDANNG